MSVPVVWVVVEVVESGTVLNDEEEDNDDDNMVVGNASDKDCGTRTVYKVAKWVPEVRG